MRLTSDTCNSDRPSVAVTGNVVHVVWYDTRDGNREIYYKRSTDGGASWGSDTRLTNDSSESDFPSVATAGNSVHVVWHDTRDGNYEVYYKRDPTGNSSVVSEDGGQLTSGALRVTPNPLHSNVARIEFGTAAGSSAFLRVYNAAGRMVLHVPIRTGTTSLPMDLSSQPDGVYVVTYVAANRLLSQKIIIQRDS